MSHSDDALPFVSEEVTRKKLDKINKELDKGMITMTDQAFTEEDSKKMHKWLGVCEHEWGHVKYPDCDGDFYTGCIKCETHKSDWLFKEFNFSSPSDKELGVMLEWCGDKDFYITLYRHVKKTGVCSDFTAWGCRLYEFASRLELAKGKAPTIALAIRNAIKAYKEVGNE